MDFVFADFWAEFGNSFIMLIVQGIIIAILMEITVKKMFDSRILRADIEKAEKLKERKTKVCFFTSVIASAVFTWTVVCSMPLPGGAYMYFSWIAIVYIVQYLMSLFGIKWFLGKIAEANKPREKKEKPHKVTVIKNPDGTFSEV